MGACFDIQALDTDNFFIADPVLFTAGLNDCICVHNLFLFRNHTPRTASLTNQEKREPTDLNPDCQGDAEGFDAGKWARKHAQKEGSPGYAWSRQACMLVCRPSI